MCSSDLNGISGTFFLTFFEKLYCHNISAEAFLFTNRFNLIFSKIKGVTVCHRHIRVQVKAFDFFLLLPSGNYRLRLFIITVSYAISLMIHLIIAVKKCQEENRFATPEEQIVLSKYVGWGGLSEAFDENNSAWATEYQELSSVLTPEEYASARESTLTAFYTSPEVITAIYKAMEQMGFKEGNLLEPSCGIGNFIGMLPEAMKNSKIYGVELDTISAGIAQQLYQKTTIAAEGFEETNLPDSFFDGVVGNVPFGDFKVSDKRYDKHKFLIHDYFFAKSLDKLRPGGVMALTSCLP